MENSNQIANRFRAVLLDGQWIAQTNYKELLKEVTWEQAITQVGSLNTIAALTFHVNYYIAGVLNVLEGGALEIRDKYSFDFEPIQNKSDWDKLYQTLMVNAKRFSEQVAQMQDDRLGQTFVDEKYGNYRRNIEGIIEHAYYHLGQLSLIKKLICG